MSNQLRGSLFLLVASVIWGFAFVAQSAGMEHVGPFTFQASRMLLAFLVLLPAAWGIHCLRKRINGRTPHSFLCPSLLWRAAVSGVFLFVASSFQQVGLQYTSVGHAGFLTSLYLLIIPIFGLFLGRRVPLRLWFCILLALAGLWALCMTEDGLTLGKGDAMMLLAAFFFTFQILSLDLLSKEYDGVQYSAIEMLTAGLLSLVCTVIFETPTLEGVGGAWLSIAYAGVLSCGVAYTFQILGQKDTPPTVAAILMSLEGVFAVLGGAMLLSQLPSLSEIIGCLLMFAATLLSQIGAGEKKKTENSKPNET